mgnify:CR=1 FL=1|jgi:hypothetical protein|tara:strand:- start:323 stop:754 length:432 start_codon:yes stop_codon:yes gene_type:complete
MAKVYTGKDARLQVDGGTVAKVVSFQISANVDVLETTTLADKQRNYTPGIVGYSGSASLLYYKVSSGHNTKKLLEALYRANDDGVKDSDDVKLAFHWMDGTSHKEISLNAYITSAVMGAATGEISRAEITFVGNGKLVGSDIQ